MESVSSLRLSIYKNLDKANMFGIATTCSKLTVATDRVSSTTRQSLSPASHDSSNITKVSSPTKTKTSTITVTATSVFRSRNNPTSDLRSSPTTRGSSSCSISLVSIQITTLMPHSAPTDLIGPSQTLTYTQYQFSRPPGFPSYFEGIGVWRRWLFGLA